MAVIETWLKSDLKKPVAVVQLTGNLFSGDNGGNKIGVEVLDNGSPATLSGGVTGYIIRADGSTVVVNGTLTGNRASIVLPASAYIVVGQVSIVVKVSTMTVGACAAYVYRTTTDTIVDPGSVVPDISELLAKIADCEAATTAANTAASSANTAANECQNIVKVSETQPSETINKLWIIDEAAAETSVPTYSEFSNVDNSSVRDFSVSSGWEDLYKKDGITWEQGKYSVTDGEQDDGNRIRTDWFAPGVMIFNPGSAKQYAIFKLSQDDVPSAYDETTWRSDEFFYIPNNGIKSIRLMERNIGGGSIAPVNNNISFFREMNVLPTLGRLNVPQTITTGQIENQDVILSDITFEQGRFTSSSDFDSDYFIRTDTFSDEVYIYNPGSRMDFSVLLYDGSSYSYLEFNDTVSGIDNFYNDSLAYLPALKVGTYRIMVRDYRDGTGYLITPKTSTLFLYKPIRGEVVYMRGAVSSSGYSYANSSVITNELDIGEHSGIRFRLVNDDYRFSVVYTDGETFGNVTYGWNNSGEVNVSDKEKSYILRVGVKSGGTFVYDEAIKAVQVEFTDYKYCYERNYTDITYLMDWQLKKIDATDGIIDSTDTVLAEIPNVGNAEVKMNRPYVKFQIWEIANDGTITMLQDWSNYFYRYTADVIGNTKLYVVVAAQSGATMTNFSFGRRGIKVYTYEDGGVKHYGGSPFYGKSVAVIGDSIVQGRFRKGNADSTNAVQAKPFPVLIAEASNTEPGDYGIGGACVYGDEWSSLYTNKGNVTGYDVVLVCAGTNDYGADVTEDNFKSAYESVLTTLAANNTEVYAVTPTRRSTDTANQAGLKLSDYAQFVKDVADDLEIKVIDLYTMTYANSDFIASLNDGIHPNETGQKIIADLILNNVQE